jgi:hypothetical protein
MHGGTQIQYLDDSQLIEKCKKLKLRFPVLVIQPAEVQLEHPIRAPIVHIYLRLES